MIDEQLVRLIVAHEGFSKTPYRDTRGFWTVGYGRCLDMYPLDSEDALAVFNIDGISLRAAEMLMRRELAMREADCRKCIPFFSTLDPVRQAALIDMTYNLGIKGLLGFKKMLAALSRNDWQSAADEVLDSRYSKQVKGRALDISSMLLTGRWPASAKTAVGDADSGN